MCYYMKQNQQRAENETVPGIYISHFFQDYAVKTEIDLELLPFFFGGPK